jgi:4-hydroxy-2-oxoheptanedioate aldolase
MKKNRIKAIWAAGRPVLNAWLSIGNGFTAEIMAAQGYDSVTVDVQHGALDYHAALGMLQAMRASDVAPMARVPWLDAGAIMKMLDAGAMGIICPMINNREEAERLVSYMRYPPNGTRSFGPTRAAFSAGPGYGPDADDEIVCFAMIETAEAIANLDAICATPGLDGVYIGPADLTLGLTGRTYRTGFDRDEPEIVEVIRRVVDTAHAAGIRAGLHNGTPEYAAKAVGWGFDLVTVANDVRLLAGAAEASVKRFRGLVGDGADAATAPTGQGAKGY